MFFSLFSTSDIWKRPDFPNHFCCLLQYYEETYTCQNSHCLIRSLAGRNNIAENSFYMMGNSNRKISFFKYPMPRTMMDAVQDKDGTDIQIFQAKAKPLRSHKLKKKKKHKRTQTNKQKTNTQKNPKQQLAKGYSKFLSLIKKT